MSNNVQKIIQLYEFYPGNCPSCKKHLVIAPSNYQRTGKKNMQVTNCPFCNEGLECIIAEKIDGKMKEVDLSKYKHEQPVRASNMIIRKSESPVLNPMKVVKDAKNKA